MPLDDPLAPELSASPAPSTESSVSASSGVSLPYRKLPGRMATLRLSNYGLRKLYLGHDHLLQVETVFYAEQYRRFAYADIQAVLVRQTSRALVLSITLAVLAAVCGGVAALVRDTEPALVFWLVAAGFFGLMLLVNLLRGPTCRCQLQTAIGPQPLLSLNRLRTARQALGLLGERIQIVQGALPAGEAAARVDEQLSKHWSA